MNNRWLHGFLALLLLLSLALSVLAWRQNQELKTSRSQITRMVTARIGELLYSLESAAGLVQKAGSQQGAEQNTLLFQAMLDLRTAEGNLVALHNSGVIDFGPLGGSHPIMTQLHSQSQTIQQAILGGDRTALAQVQASIQAMHDHLNQAWQETGGGPSGLAEAFRRAVETYPRQDP